MSGTPAAIAINVYGEDLRVLRHRFQALPARTMALVLTGAAVLAARSALRAGAGYVRIAADASHREVFQATLPDREKE